MPRLDSHRYNTHNRIIIVARFARPSPIYFLDNRNGATVFEIAGPICFLHPRYAVMGDSLNQPNFGPDFGVQIAALDANHFPMNM